MAALVDPSAAAAPLSRKALSSAISTHLLGLGLSASGSDTEENRFQTIADMWSAFRPDAKAEGWYTAAADYWEKEENCPTTIDGMLGGFAAISPVDVEGSIRFMDSLNLPSGKGAGGKVACDCGAGIGRVTRDFLLPYGFEQVDLVEVAPRLSRASPDFLGEGAGRCRFFNIGMQDFSPAAGRYAVIWIQWVIGHLDDVDCVAFLQRCLSGLAEGGVICVKDNTCETEAFMVDCDDSSVTRSLPYMEKVFAEAGCEVVKCEVQRDFPKEIYPVPMFALRASKKL